MKYKPTGTDPVDDIHYRMDSGPEPKPTVVKRVSLSGLIKYLFKLLRREHV